MGAVYKIQCETCNIVIESDKTVSKKEAEATKPTYVGCTRTSLHNRMQSHLKSQKSKQMSNPMHRHDLSHHDGNVQKYICKLVGTERKIVRLYTKEALEIENIDEKHKMNKKEEFGRGGLVRITAHRNMS